VPDVLETCTREATSWSCSGRRRGVARHEAAGHELMSLEELIEVRGARVLEHAPFGARTTYRVGGTVRTLVTLASTSDLEELAP